MTIKEQLKGTCVLNESIEMGAEIVALYTEGGVYHGEFNYVGSIVGYYYGEKDSAIKFSPDESIFDKVLTISQLRNIVKGKQEKVKFEELPELVQGFMQRINTHYPPYKGNDIINLDTLHNAFNWSHATDAERLAYCEVRYIGKEVKCLYDQLNFRILKIDEVYNHGVWAIGVIGQERDWPVLLYKDGKFAEIVSTSEVKVEEPQFKAGAVVDHKFVNSDWRSYGAVFTGGFNKKGNPIVEIEDDIYVVKDIRHPNDKLREKAEEIMSKRRKHDFSGVEYFTDGATEEMLVEAIKWGQENK